MADRAALMALIDEIQGLAGEKQGRAKLEQLRRQVGRLIVEREAARDALAKGGGAGGLRLVITPTDHLTELDGVKVRIWRGRTADGIDCHVFVHRVAVGGAADQDRFESELTEVAGPDHPVDILPLLDRLEASRGTVDLE